MSQGLTIGSIIVDAAANAPATHAVTLGDESRTFGELYRRSLAGTRHLAGLGLRAGDRVATWTDTSVDAVDVFGAVALAGMVYMPLNPRFSPTEALAAVRYLRPRLLVVDAAHRADAASIVAEVGGRLADVEDVVDPSSVPDGPRVVLDTTHERSLHAVYLTSGSTGEPKGVMLSHRSGWLRSSAGGGSRVAIRQTGGTASMFPLFHWAGWQMVTEAWQWRSPIHLIESPTADQLLAAVERRQATSLYCIPAVWERILDVPAGRYDTSSLQQVDTGTSTLPDDLIDRLAARFPQAHTNVSYGSTEAGATASLSSLDWAGRPGSVGRAVPLTTIRIAGDGEIEIRSAAMMDGYLDRPDATAAALVDGWYRSGDLGYLDEDGFLFVTGRKREQIRSGAEWVAPVEIEAALRDLPGIADLGIVGVADPRWGEIVCLAVVPGGGRMPPTVDAVHRHVARRLAPNKLPRLVVSVDHIPRTPATGQVQRAALARIVEQQRGGPAR